MPAHCSWSHNPQRLLAVVRSTKEHAIAVIPEEFAGPQIVAALGSTDILGPSPTPNGINFAIFSAHASSMKLCLFDVTNKPWGEWDMVKTGAARPEALHLMATSKVSQICTGWNQF